jgi:ketosteroid isomerase-like protein
MKKTFYLFLIFLSVSMATNAQDKDAKQVAAAVEALRTAMVSGNRSQLEAIAASHLTYGHSSGLIEDKAAFVEAIASGQSDFVSITLTDQTIQVEDEIALVRHKLDGQTNNGGKPGTAKLGVLLVWQKQQGKWKLLARQAFKL